MKKIGLSFVLSFISLSFFAQKTDLEKVSYAIGLDIAQNLQKQDVNINVDYFVKALNDVKNNQTLAISKDSINPIIQRFFTQKMEVKKNINLTKSKEFLDKNKLNKNIKVTSTGLQYEVLKKSLSKEMPKASDKVKVKYEGKLIDGTVFDSTQKGDKNEAIDIALDQVIKGWTEGIQLMNKGSKYRFYIPSDLGYGENGGGPIPPNSLLIFDVELEDFSTNNTNN